MKGILSAVFIATLFAFCGCSKEKNTNNNNNNTNGTATNSKYIELTIDGATYKYEEHNGNSVLDANGDQTLPGAIVWGDSVFGIGATTTGGNGFQFLFPVSATGPGTGSFSVPAVTLPTSGQTFSASLVFNNGTIIYNHQNVTKTMNGNSCSITSTTISSQTFSITYWGAANTPSVVENAEGTFSGTLYGNYYTTNPNACESTTAHPYSGKFKYVHN